MKKSVVFLVSLTILVSFSSCKKEEEKKSIEGTYQRAYIVNSISYQIQLTFTKDGHLIWKPVETIPGHTESTVKYSLLSDDMIKIFDDPDCNSEATYKFSVTDTKLNLLAETDTCDPRKNALSGDWPKVQ
jgi:hypothetical protein